MTTLIVATRNEHKLRELREALPELKLEPLPEGVELPPEHGETFAENALEKARAAHRALGVPVLADDSGIEASALGGRPGVRSARFAGEGASDAENLELLLAELEGAEDRRLAYVCAIALVKADGSEYLFEGRCTGTLAAEPRGSGGFGYDPAFVPDDTGPGDRRTMAELSASDKHAISHRGRAASALAAQLGAEGRGAPR
jgi:XTP/dITP diphosphohydrolase